jgi:hypothetical protein
MAQVWLSLKARVTLLQPELLQGLRQQGLRTEPEMMQRQQELARAMQPVRQIRKLPVRRQFPKSQARILKLQEPILKPQEQRLRAALANPRDKQAPASRMKP